MNATFQTFLEDLRAHVSLEEVVSEYVPLKPRGGRLMGLCPFHNEKTASFSVNPQKQLYYCFGCHKGGTVINFVMDMEHMEFMDAVQYLADRAHMELPQRDSKNPRDAVSRDERERMYQANKLAAQYFHDLLWTGEGAGALNYLYRRGLNDRDIRRFGLGASPLDWEGLRKHLSKQGFEDQLMLRAGLLVEREHGLSDMFHERVMFPIIQPQGRVLGFGGRAMGDAKPKYMNTAETPIFNKRRELYGLNMASRERGLGHLVLVEGYMDTLSLRKYGVQGVVATLGTALTQEQARLMKRYAHEIWISYDGDPPGQKAALRALDILDEEGLTSRVIDYPGGMDPDDYVRQNGLEGFEALPRHDSITYRMMRARDGLHLEAQEDLTRYTLECCRILKRVKNPVELENHLRRLSNETGYDREVLLRQIGLSAPLPSEAPKRPQRIQMPEVDGEALAQQWLITLLYQELIPTGLVTNSDFTDDVHAELADRLIHGESLSDYIEEMTDETRRARALQAINMSPLPDTREEAVRMAEGCLQTIRRRRAESRMDQIVKDVNKASADEKRAIYQQVMSLNNQ